MTYGSLLHAGREKLWKSGVSDYRIDASLLLEHVFGLDSAGWLMKAQDSLEDGAEAARYMELIERRASGEPLQYITGKAWFMGLEFEVDRSVLIPRQDTEVLAGKAAELIKEMSGRRAESTGTSRKDSVKVLDVCTGSGCIVLSLAKMLGSGFSFTGADISDGALAVAGRNRAALGLSPADAAFIKSDLFENISGTYDMIISNPPYIRTGDIPHLMREVRDHEPREALDGGEDGLLFYRRLASEGASRLTEGGILIVETGWDEGPEVRDIFGSCGFSGINIVKDLAGDDRVVYGRRDV